MTVDIECHREHWVRLQPCVGKWAVNPKWASGSLLGVCPFGPREGPTSTSSAGGGGVANAQGTVRWRAGTSPARKACWRGALLLCGSRSTTASAASRGRGCRLSSPLTASPPPSSHPLHL
ncbi:hypothetical protein Taro_050518 [Colocasia esculenta]|uniref:Uncharacterized protein n=1 Tax=Colocasia esculenta TaxID=4460 RepID=A0A843XDN7_COLES|nr:hypothetical protein [Colocasia esculenta]